MPKEDLIFLAGVGLIIGGYGLALASLYYLPINDWRTVTLVAIGLFIGTWGVYEAYAMWDYLVEEWERQVSEI